MFWMGTPSFCALTWSMSTKTCGVLAENGENTVGARSSGDLRAAATSSSVAAASSSGPRPCRSWMRMVKPPPVPVPLRTRGALGETPAGADARNRRRRNHDDERALDGREALAQIRRDHL